MPHALKLPPKNFTLKLGHTLIFSLREKSMAGFSRDAEYIRKFNVVILPKWICQIISEVMLYCRKISKVPMLEYLRGNLECRIIFLDDACYVKLVMLG